MLIYSPELSPRFNYILELIFGKLLGISYRTTNIKEEIIHHEGPCLNYSMTDIEGLPFLRASGLLYEREIIDQKKSLGAVFTWKNMPVFYPAGEPSILPFDIFAASFYMVARYEEYLPFEADEHNRFHSGESIAFHNGFLDQPIINQWALQFGKELTRIFSGNIQINPLEYQFKPTIDIDNAWAFLNKGLWRSMGALLRPGQSMAERNYRFQVWRKKQPDPFDQYEFIRQLMHSHQLDPIFFFLVGPYGPYDRTVSPANSGFKRLVRSLASEFRLGIHPSYNSNSSAAQIQKEIDILAHLSGKEITDSRQHFLKVHLPHTYSIIDNLGIKNDYSMGYADRVGFRAGIANPFRFFDLENNTSTDLVVHPFQVMDITLQEYLKMEPKEALDTISQLVSTIKDVGGTFNCLWHNESLGEWKHWTGWSGVFREMLEIAG